MTVGACALAGGVKLGQLRSSRSKSSTCPILSCRALEPRRARTEPLHKGRLLANRARFRKGGVGAQPPLLPLPLLRGSGAPPAKTTSNAASLEAPRCQAAPKSLALPVETGDVSSPVSGGGMGYVLCLGHLDVRLTALLSACADPSANCMRYVVRVVRVLNFCALAIKASCLQTLTDLHNQFPR